MVLAIGPASLARDGDELFIAKDLNDTYFAIVDFTTGAVRREWDLVAHPDDVAVGADHIVVVGSERIEVYRDGIRGYPPEGVYEADFEFSPVDVILGDLLIGRQVIGVDNLVAMELGGAAELAWSFPVPLDTADPTDREWIRDIAISGTQAAVVTTWGRLMMITMSRHGAVLRESYHPPGLADADALKLVFLDPETVLISTDIPDVQNISLLVIDVSDPDAPFQIDEVPLSISGSSYMAADGGLVLIENAGRTQVVRATDQTALEPLETKYWGQYTRGAYLTGSFIQIMQVENYGPDAWNRLDTWDYSNPESPFLTQELPLHAHWDFVVEGSWAYQVISGMVLDLADPAHPRLAGNITTPFGPRLDLVASPEYLVDGDLDGHPAARMSYLGAPGATGVVTSVESVPGITTGLAVSAAPNPFNPRVEISFEVPSEAPVEIRIFDVGGRLVADLGPRVRSAGTHSVVWEGADSLGRALPSGTYLYRIKSGSRAGIGKLMLVR